MKKSTIKSKETDVLGFKRYGGYWRFKTLDFLFLCNAYFPTKRLYDKLKADLPKLVHNYPSGQKEIARLLSLWQHNEKFFNEKNLIIGNGTCELIRILVKSAVKKITIPIPAFEEYQNKLEPGKIIFFPLKEEDDFKLNTDKFISAVKKSRSNFALIVNPNNPTPTILKKEEVEKILVGISGIANLIVDESLADFSGSKEKYSVQKLVGKYKNLIIVRSIGKEFGVPGLRLGYLLTTNEEVKNKIREYLPIWNINSIAEHFLEIFIEFKADYKESIKKSVADRNDFFRKLQKIDCLKPYKPTANFILCRINGLDAGKLRDALFEKYDILIKDCSNKPGFEKNRFIRLAVRAKKDNDKLIKALKEILTVKKDGRE